MSATVDIHDGTPPAGALTTVFTQPPGCYAYPASSSDHSPSCMPTGYFDLYSNSNYGYYSPAICPYGYTGACGRDTTASYWWEGPPVAEGETATLCCPSNFYCAGVDTGQFRWCSSSDNWVFPVQVRWQATDLAILETNPTRPGVTPTPIQPIVQSISMATETSLATTTSVDTTISQDTTTVTALPDPITVTASPSTTETNGSVAAATNGTNANLIKTGHSGLSSGAKAGVGIGVALGALALLGLLLFLIRSHRKRARDARSHTLPDVQEASAYGGYDPRPYDGDSIGFAQPGSVFSRSSHATSQPNYGYQNNGRQPGSAPVPVPPVQRPGQPAQGLERDQQVRFNGARSGPQEYPPLPAHGYR